MKSATIHSKTKALGAVMLISGTSIGGGMLVLPVTTAHVGFLPSLSLFFVVWLFMTFTAFLMLESNLAIRDGHNLISISRNVLGKPGELVAWLAFLLLLYSLMAVYITGISALLQNGIRFLFGAFPSSATVQVFVSLFVVALVIYGLRVIDKLNKVFIVGGAFSFLVILFFLSPNIEVSHLSRVSFSKWSIPLPVIVTSFGFHIILPVLVRYLDRQVWLLRMTLMIGSLIPLLLYCIWQLAIVGTIPFDGEASLSSIANHPNQLDALNQLIGAASGREWIQSVALFFCSFAILTSLVGVSVSLWDFLEDGLSRKNEKMKSKLFLTLVSFGPPLVLTIWFPKTFSDILGYAGVFVAVLLGLLPIAICWKGRLRTGWGQSYKVSGGRIPLFLSALFFAYVIFVEFLPIRSIPKAV